MKLSLSVPSVWDHAVNDFMQFLAATLPVLVVLAILWLGPRLLSRFVWFIVGPPAAVSYTRQEVPVKSREQMAREKAEAEYDQTWVVPMPPLEDVTAETEPAKTEPANLNLANSGATSNDRC